MAQSHLTGSLTLSLEDSGARMGRLGRSQLVHGRVPTIEELATRLSSVTVEDVEHVLERVLGRPSGCWRSWGPSSRGDFAGRDR